jgi:hypothetical protein
MSQAFAAPVDYGAVIKLGSARALPAVICGLWFVGSSIPLAPMALQHMVPLARDARVATNPDWVAVRHVLSTDCLCSMAVAERLVARKALNGRIEAVWLEGTNVVLEQRLRDAGYQLTSVTSEKVRRDLGAAGTPFLFVYGPDGREGYAGGYAPHRPRTADQVEDLAIIARVTKNQPMPPYPVYGCLGGGSSGVPLWDRN